MKHDIRQLSVILILLFVLAAVIIVSFTLGRYYIPAGDLLRYLFSGEYIDGNLPVLIMHVRLPRILMAVLAGGALSVSGVVYQGLFRNPMVSPDILGVSAGAGLGAAVAILLSAGLVVLQVSAFAAGLLAVFVSLSVSRLLGSNHDRILMLVLSGMIVGALFNAMIMLMKYLADSESKLPEITFWLMGSFTDVTMYEIKYILPIVLFSMIPLLLNAWKLNILSFGDEEARTLGINTPRLRLTGIVCASLLTASVVSVAGIIGWIGLIIPHFTRFIVGPDHRLLIPASFLTGASFMLLVDDFSRTVSSLEIPLGVITSLIGAPLFFLVLRMTRKKAW
ncbi:MAG: iron ABC transporter permease [Tannerella sp.]|jgi:iron complex transport system permease protein|nr:iron ABC transporter permease [Tannerella sp.]